MRKAVPEGSLTVQTVVVLTVKVRYAIWNHLDVDVLDEHGKRRTYAHEVVDREVLEQMPEIAAIVNCPHRKAYHDRCQSIGEMLGLEASDVGNQVYDAMRDEGSG